MAPLPTHEPSTAERIRSACARTPSALLAIDGADPQPAVVHHLLPDGSFALTTDGSLVGAQDPTPALLEVTDYAPLPLREPVRSLIWVRGRLLPVPAPLLRPTLDVVAAANPNPTLLQVGTEVQMLRLEVESVVVADATGAESVSVSALLDAKPDPFCAMETAWLQHLESSHRDVIARLAAKLPRGLRRGQVRPLGLDRYGIRLRVEATQVDHDVRLPFTTPVTDVAGLSREVRLLMGCPFVNGLRARSL